MKKSLIVLFVLLPSCAFVFASSGALHFSKENLSLNVRPIGVCGTYGLSYKIDSFQLEADLCMKSSPVAGIVALIISPQSYKTTLTDVFVPSGAFFWTNYVPVNHKNFEFGFGLGAGIYPSSEKFQVCFDTEYLFKFSKNHAISLKMALPLNKNLLSEHFIASLYSVLYCSSIGYRYTF